MIQSPLLSVHSSSKTQRSESVPKQGKSKYAAAKEQMAQVKQKGLNKFKKQPEMKQRFAFLTNKFVKSVDLRMSIDPLSKPSDPQVFGYIIQICRFLSVIQLWSDSCSPQEIVSQCESDPNFKSPKRQVAQPISHTNEEEVIKLSDDVIQNYFLFEGLKSNLRKSQALKTLQIVSIQLSDESWDLLAQGVSGSTTLKSLVFNRMKFSFKGLDSLAEAVRINISLEKIDLSCNDLTDDYGSIVAKFVQSQTDIRDLMKWESSLRGRQVDPTINEVGLKEFILHHNFFGKSFLRSLSARIKNDTYMKLIDLRYNSVQKEELEEFLKVLSFNQSILAVDLRFNQGFDHQCQKQLALILLKNIEKAYKYKVLMKKQWIIKPLIFIELPNMKHASSVQEMVDIDEMNENYGLRNERKIRKIVSQQELMEELGTKQNNQFNTLQIMPPATTQNKSKRVFSLNAAAPQVVVQSHQQQSIENVVTDSSYNNIISIDSQQCEHCKHSNQKYADLQAKYDQLSFQHQQLLQLFQSQFPQASTSTTALVSKQSSSVKKQKRKLKIKQTSVLQSTDFKSVQLLSKPKQPKQQQFQPLLSPTTASEGSSNLPRQIKKTDSKHKSEIKCYLTDEENLDTQSFIEENQDQQQQPEVKESQLSNQTMTNNKGQDKSTSKVIHPSPAKSLINFYPEYQQKLKRNRKHASEARRDELAELRGSNGKGPEKKKKKKIISKQ